MGRFVRGRQPHTSHVTHTNTHTSKPSYSRTHSLARISLPLVQVPGLGLSLRLKCLRIRALCMGCWSPTRARVQMHRARSRASQSEQPRALGPSHCVRMCARVHVCVCVCLLSITLAKTCAVDNHTTPIYSSTHVHTVRPARHPSPAPRMCSYLQNPTRVP